MKLALALLVLLMGCYAHGSASPLEALFQPKNQTPRASITCKPTGTKTLENFGTMLDPSPRATQCTVDNGGVTLVSDIEVGYRCFNGVCPNYPTISWRLHWPVKFYTYFMVHFFNGKDCELTLTNIWQYCTGDRCAMDITPNLYKFPLYDNYRFEVTASGRFPSREITDKCIMDPLFQAHPTNPGPIAAPRIEKTSRTSYRVHFDKPSQPNGPIDYYNVVQYDTNSQRIDYRFEARYTETGIGVQCVDSTTAQGLYIALSATNVLGNGTQFQGPLSDWQYLEFCKTACAECKE